jgi:predicted amidophosphoribosyltransferase
VASDQAPEPAGFGNCKVCAYRDVGPPATCYGCAKRTMTPVADHCCEICGQAVPVGEVCRNQLCRPHAQRFFSGAWAIAMKTGPLEAAIYALKDGKVGWGIIFARVVLEEARRLADIMDIGHIIPSPAFLAPGVSRRGNDHAGWVIEQAADQDVHGLPWTLDLIVKTGPTPKLKTLNAVDRRAAAPSIYQALHVPDPSRVVGRRVVVYDDVFTDGTTLNMVARRLREAGASDVVGLTLARQPWQ